MRKRSTISVQTTASPSSSSPQASSRNPTIDGLKFVAAGGIVLVHAAMSGSPGPVRDFAVEMAYTALFFFFLVAGYFHGPVGTRGLQWLWKRFVRLAVPYAVWSVVFIIAHAGYQAWDHKPLIVPDIVRLLFFAGADQVLWALPWLFVCAVTAEIFARTPTSRRILLVASLLLQIAVWTFVPASALPPYGLRQYIEGARWLFLYVLGMELRSARTIPGSATAWTAIGLLSLIATGALGTVLHAQSTSLVSGTVLGTLSAVTTVSMLAGALKGARWFGVARLGWGGEYLIGVYVIHHIWLDVLARVFPDHRAYPPALWIPFAWLVCFSLAVLTTKVLLSHKYTRASVL